MDATLLLCCTILYSSSPLPDCQHTDFFCDYRWPTIPLFPWLYWCHRWHTHPCIHINQAPSSHVQSQRIFIPELLLHLRLRVLFHLCTHWFRWINCRCNLVEWHKHWWFAHAARAIPTCRHWFWHVRCTSHSLPGCPLSSQRMATSSIVVGSTILLLSIG